VRLLDLCLCVLTMLSSSDQSEIRHWISVQESLPFREQLLALDNDRLTLLILLVFVATLSVKTYFIGVIWACYKYLKAHEASSNQCRVRLYDNSEECGHLDDREMLLPPKYEDIALLPESQANPPPPAYTPQ